MKKTNILKITLLGMLIAGAATVGQIELFACPQISYEEFLENEGYAAETEMTVLADTEAYEAYESDAQADEFADYVQMSESVELEWA